MSMYLKVWYEGGGSFVEGTDGLHVVGGIGAVLVSASDGKTVHSMAAPAGRGSVYQITEDGWSWLYPAMSVNSPVPVPDWVKDPLMRSMRLARYRQSPEYRRITKISPASWIAEGERQQQLKGQSNECIPEAP